MSIKALQDNTMTTKPVQAGNNSAPVRKKALGFSGNQFAHLDEFIVKGEKIKLKDKLIAFLSQKGLDITDDFVKYFEKKAVANQAAIDNIDTMKKMIKRAFKGAPEFANRLNTALDKRTAKRIKWDEKTTTAFKADFSPEAASRVKAEVKEAKRRGVKLKASPDDYFLPLCVNNGLKEITDAGVKIPKKTRVRLLSRSISDVYSERVNKLSGLNEYMTAAGNFSHSTGNITIPRLFSTGNEAVKHETGHKLHFKNSPKLYRYLINNRFTFKPETEKLVAENVGDYAALSPLELVAEVFKGLTSGEKYNDTIMSLYKKFGGPPVG